MKIRTFLFALAAAAVVACGQTPEEKVAHLMQSTMP